ncbi:MAG: hypothetical protein Q9213_001549 [Squamulea squamosa]
MKVGDVSGFARWVRDPLSVPPPGVASGLSVEDGVGDAMVLQVSFVRTVDSLCWRGLFQLFMHIASVKS